MKPRLTGLSAWAVQRVSAVYLLGFMICALVFFAIRRPESYLDWSGLVRAPFITTSCGLFFVALISHMWVGLRDVVLDYAKPDRLRRGMLCALAAALLGLALWAAFVLFAA